MTNGKWQMEYDQWQMTARSRVSPTENSEEPISDLSFLPSCIPQRNIRIVCDCSDNQVAE